MFLEEMGERIRAERTRLGLTQVDLAAALQVGPQAVSKWERGENAPDVATLPALAELLGVSTDRLLGAVYRDKRTIEATVVFADMESFSEAAEGREAADLAIMLNTFFYPLTERIVAAGGLPIKYIGDSLLAIFAGEEHRLRAMKACFEALRDSPSPLRFSASTGGVWLGPVGHPAYARTDVLGNTVNLAAQIMGWGRKRPRARVAADGSTVGPIASSLSLGDSEERAVRGREGKATLHEVLGIACP